MDQPWNPAVLEQRAGRVRRLGQHRPVCVVNFVAQGTIEHGMLNLLAFKRSLFAGVLDNGQDRVLSGGTRLNRFMESVETATGASPALVGRDAKTRQAYVKLPLGNPWLSSRLATALSSSTLPGRPNSPFPLRVIGCHNEIVRWHAPHTRRISRHDMRGMG